MASSEGAIGTAISRLVCPGELSAVAPFLAKTEKVLGSCLAGSLGAARRSDSIVVAGCRLCSPLALCYSLHVVLSGIQHSVYDLDVTAQALRQLSSGTDTALCQHNSSAVDPRQLVLRSPGLGAAFEGHL